MAAVALCGRVVAAFDTGDYLKYSDYILCIDFNGDLQESAFYAADNAVRRRSLSLFVFWQPVSNGSQAAHYSAYAQGIGNCLAQAVFFRDFKICNGAWVV